MIVRTTRLLWQAATAIREANQIIVQLQTEKRDLELAYMRIGRDLIEQFLVTLDTPEEQDIIRQRMTTALGFYRDEIAVREEHVR